MVGAMLSRPVREKDFRPCRRRASKACCPGRACFRGRLESAAESDAGRGLESMAPTDFLDLAIDNRAHPQVQPDFLATVSIFPIFS
jgi:hypothetical protein